MITIKEEDYEYRTWPRSAGGQHVGVDASVIVIHKPSGVAVIENSERSFMKNKAKGTARLIDILMRIGQLKCQCQDNP